MPEIEAETEQHVRLFEGPEIRSLQQRLMHVDCPADLSLLPVQVAENHLDLQRVGAGAGGLCQLVDRLVGLVVDEEVEPQHVVRRFAKTPSIDPAAVAQFVAFPRLADDQAHQQRQQDTEENVFSHRGAISRRYISSVRHRSCRCTTPCTVLAPSTTTREVILCRSRILSASAASVPGAMVIGLRVMMSAAARESRLVAPIM